MLHKKTKKAKSPTGKASKKSSGVIKIEKGDFRGGKRPMTKKKPNKPRKGFKKGTIPRVEKGLRDADA